MSSLDERDVTASAINPTLLPKYDIHIYITFWNIIQHIHLNRVVGFGFEFLDFVSNVTAAILHHDRHLTQDLIPVELGRKARPNLQRCHLLPKLRDSA